MKRRFVGRLLLCTPVLALALAAAPGLALAQQAGGRAAAPPGWRTLAALTSPSLLLGVGASDQAHAWAVGWTGPPTRQVPEVQAWNGSSWARVTLAPALVSSLGAHPVLDTVAASGPANVWAFTTTGRWLRFNGSAWSAGQVASPAPMLQASLAFGPSSSWVFGGRATSHGTVTPYASHFTVALGWRRTPVPGKGLIAAVSAVSSTDIWAVTGTGALRLGPTAGSLVHWSAGRWQAVAGLPAQLSNVSLGAVLARSDSDVWVGGAVGDGHGGTTEAVGHWDGHAWTVAALPAAPTSARFNVVSIAADGHGGVWALAFCAGGNCGGAIASRLWHESAGRWTGPVRPVLAHRASALVALAQVGASVWAAGDAGVGGLKPSGLVALWGAVP